MAWTEQAWRYSLANVVDPAQSLDEQQTHLTLAGVTTSSDISVIHTWTEEERYSVHGIPFPGGFNWTTRSAIANVPAVNFVELTSRDGGISPTLDGFTVDFDGTITVPTFDGDLVPSISTFTVSLAGDFTHTHYFDISYSVTPTWVVTEIPANFGDLVIAPSGFATGISGTALPPNSTQGLVDSTLDGFSPNLDGTFVVAPGRDGSIGLDIEVFNPSLAGSFVDDTGVIGLVDTALSGFTTDLDGTFEKWTTDGSISPTLGGFVVDIDAVFVTSTSVFGTMQASMGGFTVLNQGTHAPIDVEYTEARFQGIQTPSARFKGSATTKVRF